jgi:hypothetical protein
MFLRTSVTTQQTTRRHIPEDDTLQIRIELLLLLFMLVLVVVVVQQQ